MGSLVERVDPRWITKGLTRRAKSLGSHQQLTAATKHSSSPLESWPESERVFPTKRIKRHVGRNDPAHPATAHGLDYRRLASDRPPLSGRGSSRSAQDVRPIVARERLAFMIPSGG